MWPKKHSKHSKGSIILFGCKAIKLKNTTAELKNAHDWKLGQFLIFCQHHSFFASFRRDSPKIRNVISCVCVYVNAKKKKKKILTSPSPPRGQIEPFELPNKIVWI